MTNETPSAVLDFWFAPPGDPEHDRPRAFWFKKSAATDREIADRFSARVEEALAGRLDAWTNETDSALALVLLLDQFTRNIHRDTPRAFAGDAIALRIANRLIDAGSDAALSPVRRAFMTMPLEHDEKLASQDRAVRRFIAIAAEAPELGGMRDFADQHRAVIARFGRFPHRNALLGRVSTPEELAFLREPGSRF